MTENPYEAPLNFDAPATQPSDAEAIRREYLKTEASIKSVGILYYLGGIGVLFMAFGTLANSEAETIDSLIHYSMLGVLLAIAMLQFVAGAAVRKLKPSSRIAVGILSGIGLLGFPLGTLINAYILYLVFGKKGKVVFSDYYKEIIAATPHVKYRSSKAVRIILGIFLAIIVLGAIAALTAS